MHVWGRHKGARGRRTTEWLRTRRRSGTRRLTCLWLERRLLRRKLPVLPKTSQPLLPKASQLRLARLLSRPQHPRLVARLPRRPLPIWRHQRGHTASASALRADPTESPAAPKPSDAGKASTQEPGRPTPKTPPPLPKNTPPPEASKVVLPLKLSELQRRPNPGSAHAGTAPQATSELQREGAEKQRPPAAGAAPQPWPSSAAESAKTEEPGTPDESRSEGEETTERRPARRRPAGPSRARIAANDDVPSIGGLIYALNERPSNRPFVYAAAASGIWAAIGIAFTWAFISRELTDAVGFFDVIGRPATLTAFATVVGPIALFWFLALLIWRTEDLRLRSTAMTGSLSGSPSGPQRRAVHRISWPGGAPPGVHERCVSGARPRRRAEALTNEVTASALL